MKLVSQLPIEKRDAAVVSAVLALGLLVSYLSKPKDKQRKLAHVPKSTLPLLGNMLDMTTNMPRFHDWISEQCAEFNNEPWTLQIPGKEPWIVVSSAEMFEDVLKTQADNFLHGPVSQYQAYDVLGNGLSTADGDSWFYQRKTASHLFSMQMMRTVMEDTVRDKLQVFLEVLDKYSARGQPFGIKKELSHFTMDVFSKIGFGVELDTLKNTFDSEEDHEFLEAFNVASVAFGVRIQTPTWLWELKKFFNVGWEKILMDNCKTFHDFIDGFIVKAIQDRKEKKTARDLISLFLESRIDLGELDIKEDEAQIMRDMATTFIFAGKDSVAHSIGWFIVNMNRHPEVLRKVRDEMKHKLPGLLTGEIDVPTSAQLQELVYLEAAIRENIRLYPSTGFIMRQAVEATTLADGTFVDKEVSVLLPSYANARNPRTWGDDAHDFKPERFVDDSGKLRNFSQFVFSSFGSGPHICLGQKFALMELKLTIATLFSKFDLKTVEDPWEMTYEFSLTIPVKGPMDVVVTPLAAESA